MNREEADLDDTKSDGGVEKEMSMEEEEEADSLTNKVQVKISREEEGTWEEADSTDDDCTLASLYGKRLAWDAIFHHLCSTRIWWILVLWSMAWVASAQHEMQYFIIFVPPDFDK